MKISGIIFDFNGTLFWDTEFQESSWEIYFNRHGIHLSDDDKKKYLHGRNGEDTFNHFFGKKYTRIEIEKLTEDKETLYREECLKHEMVLAPGALSLFRELTRKEIKIGIATASGKTNVDFFIEKLHLLDYFAREHIIYNDGTIRGKPFPDLFLNAMNILNLSPDETIIFEDSLSGIQAAENAGVTNIYIVNSNNNDYSRYSYPVITHFDQFDRYIFK